ncbi:MAG: branched-chain amino acid ABC transporter permease [candidate division NC10 bacterium]|nr:branched-chain amino acid ABC transporter permease [candidate division NC10 bacterium]
MIPQLIVGGLLSGAIYALAAMGFVLLWQASRTINFAQGEFIMLPAFGVVLFQELLKLPFPLAVFYPSIFSTKPLRWGELVVSPEDLWVLGLVGLLILLVNVFLRHTKPGWAMQAVAQNREVARVVGINVSRTTAQVYLLNGLMMGVAAVLIAPIYFVQYNLGIVHGDRGVQPGQGRALRWLPGRPAGDVRRRIHLDGVPRCLRPGGPHRRLAAQT